MPMKPTEWVARVPVKGNRGKVLRALGLCANGTGIVAASAYTLFLYTGLLVGEIRKVLGELESLKIIFNLSQSKCDVLDLTALVYFQLRLNVPPAMFRGDADVQNKNR